MKKLVTYVLASLFLAAAIFGGNAFAQKDGLKPVLCLSVASLNDILKAGDKIAEATGNKDAFEMVKMFANLGEGFDAKQPLGVIVLGTGKEELLQELIPVLTLPISDITKLAIPVLPDMLEAAEKPKKGVYVIETPYMNIRLVQKDGWVLVVPDGSEDSVPADPRSLLPKMPANSQVHFTWNVQNTSSDLIESVLEQLESLSADYGGSQDMSAVFELYRNQLEIFKEDFVSYSFGSGIDPKNGDVQLSIDVVVKPNSQVAKQLDSMKNGKSRFSGFYQKKDAVAGMITAVKLLERDIEMIVPYYESVFAQAREQFESQEMEEDALELATSFLDAFESLAIASVENGEIDTAGTLFSDLSMFSAAAVAGGEGISDLFTEIADFVAEKAPELDIDKFYKQDYTKVGGFSLSKIVVPLTEDVVGEAEIPAPFAGKTIQFIVGVKDDAICMGLGLEADFEARFKKAITESKTPKPLPKEMMFLSAAELGKMLKPFAEMLPDLAFVSDSLIESGPDANLTVTTEYGKNSAKQSLTMNAKLLATIVKLVRYFQPVPSDEVEDVEL